MRKDSMINEAGARDPERAVGPSDRRPYAPPRILSSDPLEIAASTCEDDLFPATFGKVLGPSLCTQLGS